MPFDHIVNQPDVNSDLLHEELEAALPGLTTGISTQDGGDIAVHFISDAPPQGDKDTATATINTHDDTILTQSQETYNTIKTTAQGAVGVDLLSLTNGQKDSLLAILLAMAGGVAEDNTIAPLGQWVNL